MVRWPLVDGGIRLGAIKQAALTITKTNSPSIASDLRRGSKTNDVASRDNSKQVKIQRAHAPKKPMPLNSSMKINHGSNITVNSRLLKHQVQRISRFWSLKLIGESSWSPNEVAERMPGEPGENGALWGWKGS